MSRFIGAISAGLLTGISGLVLSLLPFGLYLEEEVGLYLLFNFRGTREPPSEVLIVTIDKVSAEKLKTSANPEKWPRALHAGLTENLAKRGASVIAFDIIFDEARSEEQDRLFATAIENAQCVVLGELLKRETVPVRDERSGQSMGVYVEKLIPPIDLLAQSALALAPFPLPKVPVRVSQYWTFKSCAGDKPTLPVVAFQIHVLKFYDDFIQLLEKVSPSLLGELPRDRDEIIKKRKVEKLTLVLRDAFQKNPSVGKGMLEALKKAGRGPLRAEQDRILTSLIHMYSSPNSRYLNFYGPPGTIHTVPFYQVLERQDTLDVHGEPINFSARAVFVGLSEHLRPEQKDGFYTVFSQPTGIDMSGVEIAATAFANLLEDRHVEPLSPYGHIALMILWGMVLGVVCRLFPALVSAACVIGLGVIFFFTAEHQFEKAGIWYPLVFPLFFQAPFAFFGTVLWRYVDTNKERQNIRRAFGYYLPNEVVDQLVRNIADLKRSDQVVYGICMFTDAAQYTTLSERMNPKELSDFMNKYFEAIFKPVKRHGGFVIDLQGDSMLAVWKAEQPDAALRREACLAALEIAQAVRRFNQSFETLKLPTRIGLHAGELLLGTVGAMDHYEYRPTGDTVNTASRMEGLNKHLGTQILVSEEVLDQVDGFLTREVGGFLVAGKSKPVVVHELICRLEECEEEQIKRCESFSKALQACRRQSWDEAQMIFQESRRLYGQDGPSEFFLDKCEEYKANPPGETWDGVVHLDNK
jgi:adenylate cyclase